MIDRLRTLVARIRRRWRRRASVRTGSVDSEAFSQEIDFHRARGTNIGEGVRLLGQIDGINPHLVSIGDYSVIGAHSALLAHCPVKGAKPVSVGRFSYIAYGALILPGVAVGDFCVVGAGAVVTKSIPDGSVVAGNPARVLRQLSPDERRHIEETMRRGKLFGWAPR